MSAYNMNVVGEFKATVDYGRLNFNLLPLNHSQNIEDVIALAETKTGREMAVIILCNNKVLREMMQDIGKHINKDRRVWNKVPIKAISAKQKDWQTRVVGFMCDVWVFAEKGISEDKTSWIPELYGTRAKL
mgnify:CR=1 FL=1